MEITYLLYSPVDSKLRFYKSGLKKMCGDKMMVDHLELEYEVISVLGI